jgi:hypothetical protein
MTPKSSGLLAGRPDAAERSFAMFCGEKGATAGQASTISGRSQQLDSPSHGVNES